MSLIRQKCYFLFCLPSSKDEFVEEYAKRKKDFVSLFCDESNDLEKNWLEYKSTVAEPYKKVADYFTKHGIVFKSGVTYDNFVACVNCLEPEVVILLTHCRDGGMASEQIEFFDRMVATTELLSTDFNQYPLIIDFSVCRPLFLMENFSVNNSSFIPFISKDPKLLNIWLYVYSDVFGTMIKHKKRYLPAFLEVYKKY